MRCCSAQRFGLPHDVSYGLNDDLGLFGSDHVPGAALDEFAEFGPAGQIHLKLMPIGSQPILLGAHGAGQPLMFQDD